MASNRRLKWSGSRKRQTLDEDKDKQDVTTDVSFLCTSVFCTFVPLSPSFCLTNPCKLNFHQLALYTTISSDKQQTVAQDSFVIPVGLGLVCIRHPSFITITELCLFQLWKIRPWCYHNCWPLKALFIFASALPLSLSKTNCVIAWTQAVGVCFELLLKEAHSASARKNKIRCWTSWACLYLFASLKLSTFVKLRWSLIQCH